jgi:hypothetical protein
MQRHARKNLMSIATAVIVVGVAACAARPSVAQNFVMDENQFNSWLYQGNGGQVLDEDSELNLMLEAVDRSSHLTNEQKEKLRLAGQGDYARFKRDVDELRAECVGKSFDNNEINEIYQKFQPLTQRYQSGLLGDKSLFSKVVRQSMSPEQREEFEAAEAERRKARHAAKVRLFVAILEQSCPLKSDQRDALVDLLLKETRPALRTSEYDWYVVIVQVAKIKDSKLSTILDKAQLKFLKKITRQAGGMEGHLKQIGVLPK